MVLGLCITHRVNVLHTVSDCGIRNNLKWVWLWPEETKVKKVASAYFCITLVNKYDIMLCA